MKNSQTYVVKCGGICVKGWIQILKINPEPIALPQDDELLADLSGIKYKIDSRRAHPGGVEGGHEEKAIGTVA